MVPADLLELIPLDPNHMTITDRFGGEDDPPQAHDSEPRTPNHNFSSVDGRASLPVTLDMVAAYKQAPQSSLSQVFVAPEDEDAFAFKIVSVNFIEDDVIYSVLFDDDSEEVAFPSEIFYDTIIKMQLVDG